MLNGLFTTCNGFFTSDKTISVYYCVYAGLCYILCIDYEITL